MNSKKTTERGPAGKRDPSFGNKGIAELEKIGDAGFVAMTPDQKIVINGSEFTQYKALRLNSDGSPDTSFGNDGIVEGPFTRESATLASASGLQITDDESIVLSSVITSHDKNYLAVALIKKTGAMQGTFGNKGVALIQSDPAKAQSACSPTSSSHNAFVFRVSGVKDSYLVKLTEQGIPDAGFNNNGFRDIPPDSPVYAALSAVTAQKKDQKMVYAFSTGEWGERKFSLGRITASGEEDLSFGVKGYLPVTLGSPVIGDELFLNTLVTLPDDRIIVIGLQSLNYFDKSMLITKITSEGAFDVDFNDGKPLTGKLNGRATVATSGAVDQKGRIVVLGQALESDGFTENNAFIARILPEGTLDTTFGDAGFVVEKPGYEHRHVTIQEDGKIVVVGFERLIDEDNMHYWRGYALRFLSD